MQNLKKELSKIPVQTKYDGEMPLDQFCKQEELFEKQVDKVVSRLIQQILSYNSIIMILFKEQFTCLEDNLLWIFNIFVTKTKSILLELPNLALDNEEQQLSQQIDMLKSSLFDDDSNEKSPVGALNTQIMKASTYISECSSVLLEKGYHLVIIANVLFNNRRRLLIFSNRISEFTYQKTEYYFNKIIDQIRRYLPILVGK